MRTGQTLIRPLIFGGDLCAFDVMRLMYHAFGLNFEDDLMDYAREGWVEISPSSMAMFKVCRDTDGDYWFVRAAVGSLTELILMMPCVLPRIAWCRNNDNDVRFYRTNRLLELAKRKSKRKAV